MLWWSDVILRTSSTAGSKVGTTDLGVAAVGAGNRSQVGQGTVLKLGYLYTCVTRFWLVKDINTENTNSGQLETC